MNRYKIHTPQSAPASAKAMLLDLQEMLGFVPNVFSVLAETPPVLAAFMAVNQRFAQTSLTAAEREIVQLAVSVGNRCGYCVAGHTAFAADIDVPQAAISALRNGHRIGDAKLNALATFARALASNGGQDVDDELEAFLAAGYTIKQVPEIILGVCVKTFSNLTSTVLGQPLDVAFQPYAWRPADQPKAA